MAQDVFSSSGGGGTTSNNQSTKMAEDPWLLNEDGYLNADTDIKDIVYHPTLNVILICTGSGIIRVLDVNSGVVLQSSYLSAVNQNEVTCRYIPVQDRVLFCDGQAIGVRSDYNGVLLLDSILQKPVSDPKKEIKLELPLSEAIILKQSLTQANASGVDHVIYELTDVILNAQKQAKKGIKAQKWNTVCLQLPLDSLHLATTNSVSELIMKNQHTPELSVASAVHERLAELSGEQSSAADRRSMASEAKRRETFAHWPHMDYKWALPDQMAQAGFYHHPNASGDDRAMCFTCTVCLVCWERTDEPWSEHERHSPNCPFVMGEYTQNVPLSVTHATNPAADATYRGVGVKILGTSTVPNMVAAADSEGLISVFDIGGKIRRTHAFYVTQFDSHILEKYTQDFGVPGSWTDSDAARYPIEKKITSLSIVSKKPSAIAVETQSKLRPTIICGLSIKCRTQPQQKSQKPPHQQQFPGALIDAFNEQNKKTFPPPQQQSQPHTVSIQETVVEVAAGDDNNDDVSIPMETNEVSPNTEMSINDNAEMSSDAAAADAASSLDDIHSSSLYLVVYDFLYNKTKDYEVVSDNKNQLDNNMMMSSDDLSAVVVPPPPASSEKAAIRNDDDDDDDDEDDDGDDVTEENQKNHVMPSMVYKHFSQLYKTFIPGESDEVFIPPPPIMVPINSNQQQHTGPRSVPVDMQITENIVVTADPSNQQQATDQPFIINQQPNQPQQPQDYSFMNGQLSSILSESFEKTISDHISELKQSKSVKKLNYSRAVQCLTIPSLYKSRKDLEISDILQTQDGCHILVVLKSVLNDRTSVLLLYSLDFTEKKVKLHDRPILIRELADFEKPLEVSLLPLIDKLSADFIDPNSVASKIGVLGVLGNIIMVCQDGAVRIVELCTMRTLCVAQLENEKFVSAAYCNSLERLCASTAKGSLHFYALNDTDNESSEDHDDDDLLFGTSCPSTAMTNLENQQNHNPQQQQPHNIGSGSGMTSSTTASGQHHLHSHTQNQQHGNQQHSGSAAATSATATDSANTDPSNVGHDSSSRCFQEPVEVISLADLRRLHALTQFEPLKAGYCAVVPPCWSEIQQAQRQRRCPQNLKTDCGDQYTKTWRLQTDTTTWDEHIFEITLPQPMALGHVDVHFSLQSATILPHVEVTLLRQNTSGIGHKKDVKFAVDETITIDMLQQRVDNPVISQEYLRAHNADILAGPVNIASCLDLSDQCGVVTLTSPKLFKSRNRTLLLHIRAVYSKDDSKSVLNKGKRFDVKPTSTLAQDKPEMQFLSRLQGYATSQNGSSSATQKNEFYMGCDCIHEISVTVYTSKHTEIAHERSQRTLMLESNVFVQSLLLTAINNSDDVQILNLALDLLIWISSIRLIRNRSNNGEVPNQQIDFFVVMDYTLTGLLKNCLLLGDRSMAHKCMKLVITCLNGAKDIGETVQTQFELTILKDCLSLLNSITEVKSPGGLQWIFALLLKVTSKNAVYVASKCVSLLNRLSEELKNRTNPYHLLLRSRYGLYGTPLEPELFDIEPPPYAKSSITYVTTYASVVAGDVGSHHSSDFFENYSGTKEGINPKDVLSTNMETKLKLKNLAPSKILKGLIETEPLHYVCVSASEGTRLERADISSAATNVMVSEVPFTVVTYAHPMEINLKMSGGGSGSSQNVQNTAGGAGGGGSSSGTNTHSTPVVALANFTSKEQKEAIGAAIKKYVEDCKKIAKAQQLDEDTLMGGYLSTSPTPVSAAGGGGGTVTAVIAKKPPPTPLVGGTTVIAHPLSSQAYSAASGQSTKTTAAATTVHVLQTQPGGGTAPPIYAVVPQNSGGVIESSSSTSQQQPWKIPLNTELPMNVGQSLLQKLDANPYLHCYFSDTMYQYMKNKEPNKAGGGNSQQQQTTSNANYNPFMVTMSSLPSSTTTNTAQAPAPWQPEHFLSNNPCQTGGNAGSPGNVLWQHLLITPPQQVIVIERMYSGARRHVTLDFGQPVLLTDVLLPSCSDLVSVTVDIWLKNEDLDGTRLVVAGDIGIKNLVLNDIQPPPLCRYLKITVVGRYGMTTAKCRIPTGYFYGHVVVLPEEIPPEYHHSRGPTAAHLIAPLTAAAPDLDKQLTILTKLFEDISCRYSLACSKLKELLRPFLVADMKNASHLANYMNIMKDNKLPGTVNPEHSKIFSAYQESITYQRQLNTVRHVMSRLERSINKSTQLEQNKQKAASTSNIGAGPSSSSSTNNSNMINNNNSNNNNQQQQNNITNALNRESNALAETSTDKLRTIAEGLLEVLLTIDAPVNIDLTTCQKLFQGFCVSQSSRLQLLAAVFLDKSCRTKSFWGNFLADTLQEMYASSNTSKFPQDRVFILLAYLSRRSPERSAIIDAALRVVHQVLTPLMSSTHRQLLAVSVDLPLLSWLLIYLSLQLNLSTKHSNNGSSSSSSSANSNSPASRRWDWVYGEIVSKTGAESSKSSSRKRCSKRVNNSQSGNNANKSNVDNLDAAQKLVQTSAQVQALSALSNHAACLNSKLDAALKTQQFLMKKVKYKFKDIKNATAAAAAAATFENTSSNNQSSTTPSSPASCSSSASSNKKNNKDGSSTTPTSDTLTASSSVIGGDKSGANEKKLPQHINVGHCLAVAKCLLKLVLSMDHSSSADMLLLSFKVMARLVSLAKIKLGQLMNQDQLLQLINFCLASKIPWAPHALACLLQDVLENDMPMEMNNSSGTWTSSDFLSEVVNLCEYTNNEDDSPSPCSFIPDSIPIEIHSKLPTPVHSSPGGGGGNGAGGTVTHNTSNQLLAAVYESDDSDFEEIIEGFFDKEVTYSIKKSNSANNKLQSYGQATNSTALDSRLDLTVETLSEISLRKLIGRNTHVLLQSVNAGVNYEESDEPLTPWTSNGSPMNTVNLQPESLLSNNQMLTQCFEVLFKNLQLQDSSNIEHILQLWLTLNAPYKDDKFDPSAVPEIILKDEAVGALISAMAWAPGLSLITWTVALQTLTLVCNTNSNNGTDPSLYWSDAHGMASCIVNHRDFTQIFLRLLSGNGMTFIDKVLAGPSLCRALNDFLDRLLMRCYVESPRSKTGKLLKTLLLKIVYQLVQPSGPIASRQGPLDVQCKLFKSMLEIDYSNADITIALAIFENTAVLVHQYFVNVDKIKCINIGEKHNVVSTAFNEIFACVMGSDPIKMDLAVSTEVLFLRLLKFLGKLVQTQFRRAGSDQGEAMDVEPMQTSSQTDESKAEQIIHQQQDNNTERRNNNLNNANVDNFADIVLQSHAPSIVRLCHSLAAFKSSSLSLLTNVSQKMSVPFSNLAEPSSVGDAVFNVLASLAKRTSDRKLILPPLLAFLSQAPQLSEPMLWFLLQNLASEEAIKNFLQANGIEILAESLVFSSNTPNTISKSGTISNVMQHFSGFNPTSDASTAIASASNSRKLQQASIENKLSLVNFAPCCTISCPSGTAQPAEILIQGTGATHRRARTPQWSYHFYPDEAHTELTLQLPSAILLREVHLQPHLSALATCPSAVSLEVSSNGPSRLVPVCPPLPTSGMVFIRLHLPVPEVVNCILIRLYRPRDANNIGLSQIRILGTSALGGALSHNSADSGSDDESHCRHSLPWLRLLHYCFALPTDPELKRQIVARASEVPRLLSTCCELLLIPTYVPPGYLPSLEKVLRDLSLHNLENGLQAIKILLNSQSSIAEPLNVADSLSQRLLIHATGYQSACELLYQICEHQDVNTPYRVAMILEWLQNVAREAISTKNTHRCNPAYISSIASILWSANQTSVTYNLTDMITIHFFNLIYNLKTRIKDNLALKYSIDSLLCSLCYIQPELFPVLLQKIGVLVPNLSTDRGASISDDRKDSESMTDDTKQSFEHESEWYGRLVMGELSMLDLTSEDLETVALVSRSPSAVQQLLDSGLPKMLNGAIFEFCTSKEDNTHPTRTSVPMAKLENVTAILKFFTDVSDEKTMRDWLGSRDGSSFWLYLLHWLCKKPFVKKSDLQSESHSQLEEVCVKFLSKVCLCHPTNQARLAKVLCKVIALQSNGISGFLRRLILQLLLENEKIPVSIKADETLYKNVKLTQAFMPVHPAFKQTYNRALLYLSTNTTLADILEQHIYFNTNYKMETNGSSKSFRTYLTKRDLLKGWFTEDSDLSMAAGVTAKDKRAKDAKNQMAAASSSSSAAATPQSKKKRYTTASDGATSSSSQAAGATNDVIGGRLIKCESWSTEQPLPLSLNLGQLLRMIESKGTTPDWPCIHLTVCQSKDNEKDKKADGATTSASGSSSSSGSSGTSTSSTVHTNMDYHQQQQSFSSALQVFSSMGGLALLAQHLPTVYPEAIRPSAQTTQQQKEKSSVAATISDPSESDWIKVEDCDDIYEEVEESLGGVGGGSGGNTSPSTKTTGLISNIPAHSLTAFGLFLRLPGYAEVLLKDMKKALCLLRLVLGVTDDGEGGDIFQLPIADTLPTLPFEVLRRLYDATPLSTDDGRLLRKISINTGVVHLLLACLGIFTHQTQTMASPSSSSSAPPQTGGSATGANGDGGGGGGNGVSGSAGNTSISTSSSSSCSWTSDWPAPGQPDKDSANVGNKSKEDTATKIQQQQQQQQHYWAKGTGFGTGSTQQSWNVEQALLKQRSEEEHVTVLLQVLASYINPNNGNCTGGGQQQTIDDQGGSGGGSSSSGSNTTTTTTTASEHQQKQQQQQQENVLPASFKDLLAGSALLPALSSYLRNDSVLDMSRHIPLYKAALQLLRALATNPQLVDLLLPQKSRMGEPSISSLLKNMKTCVDTYASKLRINTKSGSAKFKTKLREQLEELDQGEGLATLMPDIQLTANLVATVTSGLTDSDTDGDNDNMCERLMFASIEEKYMKIMKNLQFGSYEMIQETAEGILKFVISHHFENSAKIAGEQSHPTRVKRIAQEAVTLSTSLPLSYSSSVFVRYDTSRLDLMKVLITGPADTPYANGCFELDVYFPPDYPLSPMMINLETTGHHTVRFNPNLYNDGKVCLSVLNTWHGRPEEKWNAQTSSFLQVLVSIQSLILVPEPYFNEPGYERSRGTPAGTQSSKEYNFNICQATARWAMLEQILNPCPCFRDVIHAHFYLKRQEIIEQVDGWIKDLENDINEKRVTRTTSKRSPSANIDSFKKVYQQLKDHLLKLKPPEGLQNVLVVEQTAEEEESPKTPTNPVLVENVLANPGSGAQQQPAANSTTAGAAASTSNNSSDNFQQQQQQQQSPINEVDADIDMEKMVKKMCEFETT